MQDAPRGPANNCWIVDSGASRHMTGDIILLQNVHSIHGGYVAFAGDKGGFITGEGTVTNGKVSFDKVNFVKQLDHNLLSVSQICDKQFTMHFDKEKCYVLKPGFKIPDEWILISAPRRNDLYVLDMSRATTSTSTAHCFLSKATVRETVSWHRRMGHIHIRKMNHLVHNDLVSGVNVKNFRLDDVCVSCKKGKQKKKSHKSKKYHAVRIPLQLLHVDLFGPVNRRSINGDAYCLVVTDDYSRFSWVMFMKLKSETSDCLKLLITRLETMFNLKIRRIRSDNGTEFKNRLMDDFCNTKGIHHEYSSPYVPQQNGVAERKNRTLIEAARTMLADSKLPVTFWNEAVANACYTLNRVLTVKRYGKTCYELLNNRKPNLEYLEPFGAPCTMLKVDGKFDAKAEEGFFLGYKTPVKRVYNKRTGVVEEWSNVDVQRFTPTLEGKGPDWLFDYKGLFDSFNLPPEFSDEELAIQILYDSQASTPELAKTIVPPTATDAHEQDGESSTDDDNEDVQDVVTETVEVPTPPQSETQLTDQPLVQNVENSESSEAGPSGTANQNIDQNITNLDSTVIVPSHPKSRIHDSHPL